MASAAEIEREYEAAKAEYGNAMRRMRAAKAAMKPIWKARETAEREAKLAVRAQALEAWLGGASKKEVAALLGVKQPDVYSLQVNFMHEFLEHEEIYTEEYLNGGVGDREPARMRLAALALRRYHDRGLAA
ncbi:MAG TPA: hypothetical protein VGH84_00785 [Steroidobacteraceae bacterium]|jgi:hypothetical protein